MRGTDLLSVLKSNANAKPQEVLSPTFIVPAVPESTRHINDRVNRRSKSAAASVVSSSDSRWVQAAKRVRATHRMHALGTELAERLHMSFKDKWTSSCADTA